MDELRDRVAVVTGAASGIGLALCERFVAEGMRVVMADVDPARLEASARQLREDSGAEVVAAPADAASWESVEALADRAFDEFGAVHVLCNNAGVTRPAPAWELTLEEWRWVLGVNLDGVFHGIKAFVPRMLEKGEPGHVVNTASISGLLPYQSVASYAASKYGVVGLSETLALDLREATVPIGVSVLCPGPTETQFRTHSRSLNPAGAERTTADDYAGVVRIPSSDVAGMVVDAIRSDRFWIITHPAYHEPIEQRCRGIVETDELVAGGLL
jgi:NAD(P)-dependent dehydrogenase (short-subunit alcohol dehydrogenase family)